MGPLNIAHTTYRVSDFISWQRAGSLTLSPSFQRRPVWPILAKSYFIDTIIRGLPVPIVYLRERSDLSTLEPVREVVDGQQRLRTLISFIAPELLPDLVHQRDVFTVNKAHNLEFSGIPFSRFPKELRASMLNYEFSIQVLPVDTDDQQILKIFARLNSTGMKLNTQELRNAEFFGEFKLASYDLAYQQLNRWRTWSIFNENEIARMDEVEMTSDLMNMVLSGPRAKTRGILDRLYRDKEDSFPEEAEVRRRFSDVMDIIDDVIGIELPHLQFNRKPLFYTLFTFIYDNVYGIRSNLSKLPKGTLRKNVKDILVQASVAIQSGDFDEITLKALRGATSDLGSRTARLQLIQDVAAGAQR